MALLVPIVVPVTTLKSPDTSVASVVFICILDKVTPKDVMCCVLGLSVTGVCKKYQVGINALSREEGAPGYELEGPWGQVGDILEWF